MIAFNSIYSIIFMRTLLLQQYIHRILQQALKAYEKTFPVGQDL